MMRFLDTKLGHASVAAVLSTAVFSVLLYTTPSRWTIVLIGAFIVFVWVLTRDFAFWCRSMSGTALLGVISFNCIPAIKLNLTSGFASMGLQIDERMWVVDAGLIGASLGFAMLAYSAKYPKNRAPTKSQSKNSGPKTSATSGPNSPATVHGNVIYDQRACSELDDETVRSILRRFEQTFVEKDGQISGLTCQISERDEIIRRLQDSLTRAEAEAAKGDANAREALHEARESGNAEKLQIVLEAAADQEKEDFVNRCIEIAVLAFLRGDFAATSKRLEQVLRLEPKNVDANLLFGQLEFSLGNFPGAENAYRNALNEGEVTGDQWVIAVALGNLGNVFATRSELAQAKQLYSEAIEIKKKLGRVEELGVDLGNLAIVHFVAGDFERAKVMIDEAIAIDESQKQLEAVGRHYINLSYMYFSMNDAENAIKYCLSGVEINEKLGRIEGIATGHLALGNIYCKLGELDLAELEYLKALKLNAELGRIGALADTYMGLGILLASRHEYEDAIEMFKNGAKIEHELGRPTNQASHLANMGNAYNARGETATAQSCWNDALGLFEKAGMGHMAGKVRQSLEEVRLA